MKAYESDYVEIFDSPASKTGRLAVRRYRKSDAPRLVFAHATGMCASAYRQFLHPFSERFDVIAPDLRGHGRTALKAVPFTIRNWSVYADDLEALIKSEPVTDAGWVMMGHSMGAVTSLLAASRGNIPVSQIILIDPVIIPTVFRFIAQSPLQPLLRDQIPIARQARARRSQWTDRAAVENSYGRKGFFSRWAEGVLQDYLEDGLVEDETGVRLSCDPEWECTTFAAQGQNFWRALDDLTKFAGAPVTAFVAERGSTTPSKARIKLRKAGVNVVEMPETAHLVPLEQPADLSSLIVEHL